MQIAHYLESFAQDVRFGVRTLTRSRGVTLVTVVVLALGIGANTTIFSVLSPFYLRPLDYPDAEQLVHLHHTDAQQGIDRLRFSPPQLRDLRAQSESFSGIGAYDYTGLNLTGGGEPEQLIVGRLTANSLRILGALPLLGRSFEDGDAEPGAPQVAILGHGLWQRRYGGRRDVLGETVRLNGEVYTVVGVMDRGFRFPYPEVRMWVPRVFGAEERDAQGLEVFARRKPGVTAEAAFAELRTIHQRLAQQYPEVDGLYGVRMVPIRQSLLFAYDEIKMVMTLLMATVGFVLLIVAANVANLMLAKAGARSTEVAVRASLGAARGRLLRQLLTESAVLAVAGGALGVALAHFGTRALAPTLPEALFHVGDLAVDGLALTFTLGVSLVTATLFGLVPALRGTRVDLVESLKDGGRSGGEGRRGGKLRALLVVSQISLAVLLLCGAVAMLHSAHAMQNVDLGFEDDGVLAMNLVLPKAQYETSEERLAFLETLTGRLEGLPGVESAAVLNRLPLNFAYSMVGFEVPGRVPAAPDERLAAHHVVASPAYFDVMRIDVRSGRAFRRGDTADASKVVVVNQVMAERFWPGRDPVGETLRLKTRDGFEAATIAGVAGNVRDESAWQSTEVALQVYRPAAQVGATSSWHLVLRTAGEPLTYVDQVRREIRRLDAELPLSEVRSMEQVVLQSLGPIHMASRLLGAFSAAAMLLAAVGIYGVVAYSVARRRHELGIRMALGAGRGSIVRLVLRQGLVLTAAGVGLGLAMAFVGTKVLTSALSGVSASVLGFAAVALVLGGVALLASYLPARRASRIDPMLALRHE